MGKNKRGAVEEIMEMAVREEYEKAFGKPAEFELTLDGLGLEDFPEREYFLEAGRLLREAKGLLLQAAMFEQANTYGKGGHRYMGLSSRIDKLLAGEPSQ